MRYDSINIVCAMQAALESVRLFKPVHVTGPGRRVSTYRGNTTRFNQYCGKRQRERYLRNDMGSQQLASHKGPHVVKPRHIFGREAA